MKVNRYFYDTEFLEDGKTIDLISIGIVADDGRQYYAVSSEFDEDAVSQHDWLLENVYRHLPLVDGFRLDRKSPEVKDRETIAKEVADFIGYHSKDRNNNELWAYFGAYDHIALCQLFGTMMDLPPQIPMCTFELRQIVSRWDERPPKMSEHHALADAKWNKKVWEWYHKEE